jgi:hypothetical protein
MSTHNDAMAQWLRRIIDFNFVLLSNCFEMEVRILLASCGMSNPFACYKIIHYFTCILLYEVQTKIPGSSTTVSAGPEKDSDKINKCRLVEANTSPIFI